MSRCIRVKRIANLANGLFKISTHCQLDEEAFRLGIIGDFAHTNTSDIDRCKFLSIAKATG